MLKSDLEFARKLLEVRKECISRIDCEGCEYIQFCEENHVAESTNRLLEVLLDEAENNKE